MKCLQFTLAFSILFCISCSKDDSSSKCDFIGKWCIESILVSDECFPGTHIEFRSNGELIITSSSLKWESSDCMQIDVYDATGSTKGGEYTVHSVSDDKMVLDIGAGPTDYIKIQ